MKKVVNAIIYMFCYVIMFVVSFIIGMVKGRVDAYTVLYKTLYKANVKLCGGGHLSSAFTATSAVVMNISADITFAFGLFTNPMQSIYAWVEIAIPMWIVEWIDGRYLKI